MASWRAQDAPEKCAKLRNSTRQINRLLRGSPLMADVRIKRAEY
jgi:hypothetical protein